LLSMTGNGDGDTDMGNRCCDSDDHVSCCGDCLRVLVC